ncbi:molybdenum cofactor biosynthesis protein [Salinisphaera hydrothermalis]|uniref:Molybdopterin synthase catalytic subunit n=1 Tax=Salinisphaera hydrothermalis (strain C41B8) TaxID=1304275 RepID=A0A084ILE6_SALHC|nr:molybdenum cofactor biosynthesis protein MoaE [Salinisphaera hydrothermalis]KEZ77530.1 molybdopterin synthase subunit MoaE [Salinisphaera hydrothermalis C41B8]
MPDVFDITLECHGALTDLLGGDTVQLALDAPHTVDHLIDSLSERWPEAAGLLARTACARGDALLPPGSPLGDDDRIALIPPVSGGVPGVADDDKHLTAAPLDLDALMAETEDERCGALVIFGGTVRLTNAGRTVESMDYSAYGPLAARTMADIERETLEAFDIHACRLQHRTGRLGLGEMSVYVVVRAVHRRPAFEAAEHALEELKARVAVWKNEYYSDGTRAYLEGTEVPTPERPRHSPGDQS